MWVAHVVYIMGLLITVMYGVALEVEVAKEQVVEGGLQHCSCHYNYYKLRWGSHQDHVAYRIQKQ